MPALADVLPGIRNALEADATDEPEKTCLEKLFPRIRAALSADDASASAEDVQLASAMRDALPKLEARVSASYRHLRSRVEAETPCALDALRAPIDLLSPLSLERHEPTHTRCLTYFLNPRESHGLGTRTLREFFRLMGRLIPGDDAFERASQLDEENERVLRTMKVSAEHPAVAEIRGKKTPHRADIWIESPDHERVLMVVVENKIDAAEHGDQLAAYESAVWRRVRETRSLSFDAKLVYLTPDGHPPTERADQRLWLTVDYTQLAAVLVHAANGAPEPGRSYLLLYLSSVLRRVLRLPRSQSDIGQLKQLRFLNEVVAQGETL